MMVSQGKRSWVISAVLVTVAVSVLIGGCARELSHQASLDQAMSYINQKNYTKAIEILEPEHQLRSDRASGLMLAQAYLGRADFEMLNFVNRVLGKQESMDEAREFNIECGKGRSISWISRICNVS